MKLEFIAYQEMCEGSQAEGSLGQSVGAVNQTMLAGEYLKKKKNIYIYIYIYIDR